MNQSKTPSHDSTKTEQTQLKIVLQNSTKKEKEKGSKQGKQERSRAGLTRQETTMTRANRQKRTQ